MRRYPSIKYTSSSAGTRRFDLGTTEVRTKTWTFDRDVGVEGFLVAGEESVCDLDVKVTDNDPPIISCPGEGLRLATDTGMRTKTGAIPMPHVHDAVDGAPAAYMQLMQARSDVWSARRQVDKPVTLALGSHKARWTVTDSNGNTATCLANVTVVDEERPRIQCPQLEATYATDPNINTRTLQLPSAKLQDNVGISTASVADLPARAYPVGTTTETFLAADLAGNTASCTVDVVVVDDEKPLVICPRFPYLTVFTEPGTGSVDLTYKTGVGFLAGASRHPLLQPVAVADNVSPTSGLKLSATIKGTMGKGELTPGVATAFNVGRSEIVFSVADSALNKAAPCTIVVVVVACPGVVTQPTDSGRHFATPDVRTWVDRTHFPAGVTVVGADLAPRFPYGKSSFSVSIEDAKHRGALLQNHTALSCHLTASLPKP